MRRPRHGALDEDAFLCAPKSLGCTQREVLDDMAREDGFERMSKGEWKIRAWLTHAGNAKASLVSLGAGLDQPVLSLDFHARMPTRRRKQNSFVGVGYHWDEWFDGTKKQILLDPQPAAASDAFLRFADRAGLQFDEDPQVDLIS